MSLPQPLHILNYNEIKVAFIFVREKLIRDNSSQTLLCYLYMFEYMCVCLISFHFKMRRFLISSLHVLRDDIKPSYAADLFDAKRAILKSSFSLEESFGNAPLSSGCDSPEHAVSSYCMEIYSGSPWPILMLLI